MRPPSSARLLVTLAIAATLIGASTSDAVAVSGRSTGARGASPDAVAVFAGGCFWGVEAVFESLKGVKSATSGYAGGMVDMPSYEEVSAGTTGHAEAVRIVYDPTQVSYQQLLDVFFSVAHDPTQLNRQGPDRGTQYRSAIFYADDAQKRAAEAHVAALTKAKAFRRPIVTQIQALKKFYEAEAYHQDYMARHPNQPYIVINDAPKVEALKRRFPALVRASARR